MDKLNRIKRSIKGSISKLNLCKLKDCHNEYIIHRNKTKLKEIENLLTKLNEVREKYYEILDIRDVEEIESDLAGPDNRLEEMEHTVNFCYSKYYCFVYSKRILLHSEKDDLEPKRNRYSDTHLTETQNLKGDESVTEGNREGNSTVYQTLSNMSKQPNQAVLLNTTSSFIEDARGRRIRIRCILDNGSNINCLTNECAEILGLKKISYCSRFGIEWVYSVYKS
ncbi:hypothetical protein NPIL_447721 [Nephila pilipes]|uniref:Uncharacterized protein n=1 Tax=Nephila pilipes TaxID=299642 RepID=A0A8X6N728_NEPPI|nr:hypothetical protein NPIL_447721 [Nephila pilipes]